MTKYLDIWFNACISHTTSPSCQAMLDDVLELLLNVYELMFLLTGADQFKIIKYWNYILHVIFMLICIHKYRVSTQLGKINKFVHQSTRN